MKDKGLIYGRAKRVLLAIVCVLLVGVLVVLFKYNDKKNSALIKNNEKVAQRVSEEYRIENEKREAEQAAAKAKKEKLLKKVPGIVCWGDGLTSGFGTNGTDYPTVLEALLKSDGTEVPVVDMGVVAEDTKTIMARAGAYKVVLEEGITIPTDQKPVEIKMGAENGEKINLVRTGNKGFKLVTIGGVEGIVSVEQPSVNSDNYKSDDYKHFFTRNEPGGIVRVKKGTQIVNGGSYWFVDYIPILFMGENGGWDDNPQTLIGQQEEMLKTFDKNADNFIIIGLVSGTSESRKDLDSALKDKWGKHFLNIREYLTDKKNLENAKIKLSEEDLKRIDNGEIPKALISADNRMNVEIHLNASGQTMIGEAVYKKLSDLKYLKVD